MNIIDRMKNQVKGYNKHLTDEVLDNWSVDRLLTYCHPSDREEFKTILILQIRKVKRYLIIKGKMKEGEVINYIADKRKNIMAFKNLITNLTNLN